MAKKSKSESDESRLKQKISLRWNEKGDDSFRALRKRLKRVQRKRRAMVARKARVAGKGTEGKGESAGGS